jgi:fluoroacetyl-CoA thioesterase
MSVPVGATGSVSVVVGEADLAIAVGSGDVPVLATPRVIALCEAATCRAVAPHLPDGSTTVGVRVEIEHLRATPVSGRVTATAEVVEVDGRRHTFAVQAIDEQGEIARGVVVRVLVDRDRFMSSLG